MNAAGQTICLVMIVKNEAPVIRRCLESVRPIIDHWVIVDTGSTDGTQDIIRADLEPLPGTLYERPWQDFAHNRSEALALARSEADYSFIIDADDMLLLPDGFVVPELTADCYVVDIEDPPLRYQRTQLVLNTLPWRYQGVLHEYLTCEGAGPPGHFPVLMRRNHDGARRRDPATYCRDAAVLEEALRTETDPFLISRYRFYLAQSYRDCGERENALANYLARAELGGWTEEVYISLYFAAQLKEALNHPEQEVIDTYERATDLVPSRVEALHGASRFCRYKSRNEEGYQLARRGLDVQQPAGALFVEPWIYETGLLDEYAVNAYWSGHYREALDASLKVLATGKVPAGDMQRVVSNARFSAERVTTEPHKPNLGSLGAEGFIEQHTLVPARNLHSRLDSPPRVLIAILAKQKEPSLPLYLECIEALDYPKSSIVLYIRTNNNTDRTEAILRDWVARVGKLYAGVEFDAEDVAERVEHFGVHEWNPTRFSVLGRIRNVSLQRTLEHRCDFYFVCDVDNFIRPCTLKELVALNLPIVAPFLRSIDEVNFYSNYHAELDENGYYKECDQYHWILNRHVRGVIEIPLIHCTYLVRADICDQLTYHDASRRFEYVIFSESARKNSICQYFDNRQIYGYITFNEGSGALSSGATDKAREHIKRILRSEGQKTTSPILPSVNIMSWSTETHNCSFVDSCARILIAAIAAPHTLATGFGAKF